MVVREDLETLRYNTAIARLIELTTHAAQVAAARGALPRALAEPLVLMVAPLAPHIAEELWARLGHPGSLAYAPFPVADPALAAEPTVELPVQVNGKVRFTIEVPADAGEDEIRHVLTGQRGLRPAHRRRGHPAHRHRPRPHRERRHGRRGPRWPRCGHRLVLAGELDRGDPPGAFPDRLFMKSALEAGGRYLPGPASLQCRSHGSGGTKGRSRWRDQGAAR